MSKYFIEYTKHKLIISCDVLCCYINLLISEYDSIYVLFSLYIQRKKCIMALNK